LSRDRIVAAVADLLVADPEAPLTMARAAEAAGAKPMSLYRHFHHRDELVAAVARHVLFEPSPPVESAIWQDQVAAWMTAVYGRSTRVPQLVQLMASGESTEWLVGAVQLASIFERCGLDDDRLLAEAIYWVATITMGHAMIDAASPPHLQAELVQASLDRLDAGDARRVAGLVPQFNDMRGDGFQRVVRWTIEQLERMVAGANRQTKAGA
jgi:AcrR family transcriptional regulator